MIRFTGMNPGEVTASVNTWLKEHAGKIVVKQRILDETKQQIILFYEEKLRIRTKIVSFTEGPPIADWLKRMQTAAEQNRTLFRVVQSVSTLMHNTGNPPYVLREIYYEEEVVEEKV